ncbi:hypothetical protein T552_00720 [Pneumocystis carinii B80]|uniref:Trafficking protein particle complex subunit 11 domain-containing protein n=1 Tax=Pneumocystis carinii (strain B80) TaxID=1408658 RepID=A0A0W4ZPE9_PNEC8|nr:hypothetical protein T552_00720 [Pneumocystis carinii B80]KTW30243.1 hypothetical protein T552_00720 [Pneumocystis carinii B80]
MNSAKITVTYTDNFNLWLSIYPTLQYHLPLKNIHWKSSNGVVRYIDNLEINIKPYHQTNSDGKPHQLQGLLDNPYLNIFLVKCEDIDVYRSHIRSMIRSWYSMVTSKKNQEWLIVHVVLQLEPLTINKNINPSKFLSIKASVYDKIKAEFNTSKRDRCVQLRLGDIDEIESWQDFVVKMKEGIVSSFNARILQYEEDIKKIDSQKSFPGWNYCTFFILKEGLAQSFEQMTLIEDSLAQYDELESLFHQTIKDNQLTWFENIGGTDLNDDSESILDTSKKPYRMFILQNTISLFDFRIYLFARQCQLLRQLGEYADILQRGRNFIVTMAIILRKNEETLIPWFIESWIWSSVHNLINITEGVSKNKRLSALRGELLFLARLQLDKIGAAFGHIPNNLLFSDKFTMVSENNARIHLDETEHITNMQLVRMIDSKEEFLKEYHTLNNYILMEFQEGDKPNSVGRILSNIASFQHYLKQYKKAADILKNVPEFYSKNGWEKIECSMIQIYASCAIEIGDIEKYMKSCLSLLTFEKYLPQDKTLFYIKEIEKYSKVLSNDISYPLENYFSAHLDEYINQFEDKDSYFLELILINKISQDISIQSASVKMHKESDSQELCFIKENIILKHDKNVINLISNITSPGNYIIETIEIKIGKICLVKNFLYSGKKFCIALFPRIGSLDVKVTLPSDILLNKQRISIEIDPGKNNVISGHLDIKFNIPNLKIHTSKIKAYLFNKNDLTLGDTKQSEKAIPYELEKITENNILTFGNINSDQILSFIIPYFSDNEILEIKAKISVTYFVSTNESYIYISNFNILTTLPLTLDVRNYFRKQCIFSQFLISFNTSSLRIISTKLEESNDFFVSPSEISNNTLILPSQSASFIFKIVKKNNFYSNQPLTFNIIYHTLEEEMFYIASNMFLHELQINGLCKYYSYIIRIFKKFQQSKINHDEYGLKQIIFTENHISYWKDELNLINSNDRAEIIKIVQKIMSEFENFSLDMKLLNCPWKEAKIHVKIPTIHVLHSVDFIIKSDTNINNNIYSILKMTVGEPLYAELRIQQTLGYEIDKDLLEKSVFFYEIHVDNNTWLLSGYKKASFFIKDDCLQVFSFVLIPLKSGYIMLPTIDITTSMTSIRFEVDYNYDMKHVLVLPAESSVTFHLGSFPHSESLNTKSSINYT